MPRKRKGPPQDSIDSILLAISRRDDIDVDTLAHYFERLDEEWTQGAREKVLHLLYTRDMAAHGAAVKILTELATSFDLEEIEDVVADPTVSDLAKLSLAPVLKELDSEMADDNIVEYLNDPLAAMQQMQLRLLELVGENQMGIEAVIEDVISMPVERRLGFVSWLGASNDHRAAHLLLPLLENQPVQVVTEVIDALEQLGTIALPQSIPALNYLIATTSNRSLKQKARSTLGRLTMQAAPGAETAAINEASRQEFPPHDVRTSFIDGTGAQLIMLSWRRPDGLLRGASVLYLDTWGIKDCYGVDEIDVERWEVLATNLEKQGFSSFQIPLEHARSLIVEGRSTNKKMHHKLPTAYTIWRTTIEGGQGAKKNTHSSLLPPLELTEETIALAQRAGELYKLPEFISWMYDPLPLMEPYMKRYWNLARFLEPDILHKRNSKNKPVKKAFAEIEEEQSHLLEELITRALTELVDEKWRTLYEARLRRQAALFKAINREHEARLMQAAATVLAPSSPVPLQEQAFPRALMRVTIQQGPMRLVAEALESTHPQDPPWDL